MTANPLPWQWECTMPHESATNTPQSPIFYSYLIVLLPYLTLRAQHPTHPNHFPLRLPSSLGSSWRTRATTLLCDGFQVTAVSKSTREPIDWHGKDAEYGQTSSATRFRTTQKNGRNWYSIGGETKPGTNHILELSAKSLITHPPLNRTECSHYSRTNPRSSEDLPNYEPCMGTTHPILPGSTFHTTTPALADIAYQPHQYPASVTTYSTTAKRTMSTDISSPPFPETTTLLSCWMEPKAS